MKSFKVVVSGSDFIQALKILQIAAKGKNPPNLVIYSDPEGIELNVGGATAKVKGTGVLYGQARIPGVWVSNLKRLFTRVDEVVITQDEKQISFDNIRVACHWDIPETAEISIPINAILLDVLVVGRRYSKVEIEKAGLLKKYEAACQDREKRVQRALELLSPMGVKEKDINKMVDEIVDYYAKL